MRGSDCLILRLSIPQKAAPYDLGKARIFSRSDVVSPAAAVLF